MSQRHTQLRDLRDRLRAVRADLKMEEREHEEVTDRYHRLERELLHMIARLENATDEPTPPDTQPQHR